MNNSLVGKINSEDDVVTEMLNFSNASTSNGDLEKVKVKIAKFPHLSKIIYMFGFIPVMISEATYNFFLSTVDNEGFGQIVDKDAGVCTKFELPLLGTENEVFNLMNDIIRNFNKLNIDTFSTGDYSENVIMSNDTLRAFNDFDADLTINMFFEHQLFKNELEK